MIRRFKIVAVVLLLASALVSAQKNVGDHPLKVAFVISERFDLIDFAGPWEVFNAARLPVPGNTHPDGPQLFETFTVSDATAPVKTGISQTAMIPDFTFQNAPKPDIVVVGAQDSRTPDLLALIKKQNAEGATAMSVYIRASKVPRARLLEGKLAT